MMNVIIDSRSEPLSKALALGNSNATGFAIFNVATAEPVADGIYPAGLGGQLAPSRLVLFPYCEGPAGASFSVRLYGWRDMFLTEGNPQRLVWLPFLLAELACVSCNQPGPPAEGAGTSVRLLLDSERLCDTISLTQGNLGINGFINSTGPGTDLIASAIVDLAGCRKFAFDFGQSDPVSMNCFWARA